MRRWNGRKKYHRWIVPISIKIQHLGKWFNKCIWLEPGLNDFQGKMSREAYSLGSLDQSDRQMHVCAQGLHPVNRFHDQKYAFRRLWHLLSRWLSPHFRGPVRDALMRFSAWDAPWARIWWWPGPHKQLDERWRLWGILVCRCHGILRTLLVWLASQSRLYLNTLRPDCIANGPCTACRL